MQCQGVKNINSFCFLFFFMFLFCTHTIKYVLGHVVSIKQFFFHSISLIWSLPESKFKHSRHVTGFINTLLTVHPLNISLSHIHTHTHTPTKNVITSSFINIQPAIIPYPHISPVLTSCFCFF